MIRRHTLGFFTLLAWYVGIPLILVGDQLLGGIYLSFADALPFLISITLYTWILGNVILTIKIPILQNFIPYDKRIQFHIASSFGIFATFLLHSLTRIFDEGYFIDFIAWSLFGVVSILFLLSWYWVRVPLFSVIQKLIVRITKRESKEKYDVLKLVHGLGFRILAVLTYIHVNRSSVEENGLLLSRFMFLALFLLTLFVVIMGSVHRFRRARGVVAAVLQKNGICILQIEVARALKYRAGQFAFISFPENKALSGAHPFSFLSSPNQEKNIISFGIKNEGDFTGKLAEISKNTPVCIDGAYGAFCPNHDEKLCLIGTGIGVVPILSIFGSREFDAKNMYAIFSVRHAHEIPNFPALRSALNDTASDPTRFSAVYDTDSQQMLGNAIVMETAHQARISTEHFQNLPGKISDYTFYLCSSPVVRNAIVKILQSLGVSPSSIVYERFSF